MKIEIMPSPRIDYCSDCGKEHGYDCPKENKMEERVYDILRADNMVYSNIMELIREVEQSAYDKAIEVVMNMDMDGTRDMAKLKLISEINKLKNK